MKIIKSSSIIDLKLFLFTLRFIFLIYEPRETHMDHFTTKNVYDLNKTI